jgi:hypothetical protein
MCAKPFSPPRRARGRCAAARARRRRRSRARRSHRRSARPAASSRRPLRSLPRLGPVEPARRRHAPLPPAISAARRAASNVGAGAHEGGEAGPSRAGVTPACRWQRARPGSGAAARAPAAPRSPTARARPTRAPRWRASGTAARSRRRRETTPPPRAPGGHARRRRARGRDGESGLVMVTSSRGGRTGEPTALTATAPTASPRHHARSTRAGSPRAASPRAPP